MWLSWTVLRADGVHRPGEPRGSGHRRLKILAWDLSLQAGLLTLEAVHDHRSDQSVVFLAVRRGTARPVDLRTRQRGGDLLRVVRARLLQRHDERHREAETVRAGVVDLEALRRQGVVHRGIRL